MKTIFILTENIRSMNLFSDLEKRNDVEIQIPEIIFPNNRIGTILKKIDYYVHIPFRHKFYPLSNGTKQAGDCIVIDSGVLRIYPYKYFLKLKKKYNVNLCLLLLNSMNASSPNIVEVKSLVLNGHWDAVYTFDKQDADKYGWDYFGLSYFSKPNSVNKTIENSDVYFVGGLKGNRDSLILNVFERLNIDGVKCSFDIYCYTDEQFTERRFADKIRYYRTWKKYDEIQSEVQSTNCIIEILQDGQTTQSIRYFEAVYYNKKLLTNNPEIVNLPFYNPKYMKYFRTAEDIDVEWVKTKEKIDYGYNGEFSPLHLYRMIQEQFGKV